MLCTNLWLRIEQPAATTLVLNHFTRWSQTQTYRFVRAALRKFCNSIHTMCFIAERSRLHKSEVLLKDCWGTHKGCRTALRSVWEPLGKRNICISLLSVKQSNPALFYKPAQHILDASNWGFCSETLASNSVWTRMFNIIFRTLLCNVVLMFILSWTQKISSML